MEQDYFIEMEQDNLIKVSDLWNEIINRGYIVRSTSLDGLSEWQPLKQKYEQYQKYSFIISNHIQNLVKSYYKTPNNDTEHNHAKLIIGNCELDTNKETEHFIVQHFRIPAQKCFKLSLVKVLQIAYNIGQFKAEQEKGTYHDKIISFYRQHKLSLFETYF
jgi:hypothetical protein